MIKKELTWLCNQSAELVGMGQRGQLPQAIMIHGLPGTGRRALAAWLATWLLGQRAGPFPCLPPVEAGEHPACGFSHPDLLTIEPPPEKAAIPVEAIRELTAFLQLRSHQGGARVVILCPAESMTTAAANGLLKTLEEPPAASHIILLASSPARLPATVVSRCHRVRITPPRRIAALEWLNGLVCDQGWELLLDYAGGAPLEALGLQRAGFTGKLTDLSRDLDNIAQGGDSAAAVARRWVAEGLFSTAVRWLYIQAAAAVRASMLVPRQMSAGGHLKSSHGAMTMVNAFGRLRRVEDLQRTRSQALGGEVQLAALLQGWHG